MIRVTLAQMRASLGRLAAAGLAIVLGTAFVAATLLAGDVMNRTGRDAVTATLGQADLVVRSSGGAAQLAEVRATQDVQAADPMLDGWAQLTGPKGAQVGQLVLATPSDERLTALTVTAGRAPAADDEVALPADTLERLGVEVGGTVQVTWYPLVTETGTADDSAAATAPTADATATAGPDGTVTDADGSITDTVSVVGVADDPTHAWASWGGAGLATAASTLRWGQTSPDESPVTLLVAVQPGTLDATHDALVAVVGSDLQVLTRDQAARQTYEQMGSGYGNVLVAVVLAFAAVALLVAALVIANTFTVLVAQRTRRLALLRCVGATRGQLRRSVLLEAALLGAGASALGMLTGSALAQLALTVLRQLRATGVPLPATVHLTWPVVVVPLLVGTLVTVLASQVPARAATRVSPVEALRPLDVPPAGSAGGRVRLVIAVLLAAGGLVGLLGAVALSTPDVGAGMVPLGLGVLAGATSFVGILLGGVYWLPPLVRLAGRAVAATGPVGRLAAANTVRNPRRTAATSTALLIGVTLVVMMSTGAATARTSLGHELDQKYPFDIEVGTSNVTADGRAQALPAGVEASVQGVDGVARTARVTDLTVLAGDGTTLTVSAVDRGDAALTLRDPALAAQLADGVLLVPDADSTLIGATTLEAASWDGLPTGAEPPVQVHGVLAGSGSRALITPATAAEIDPAARVTGLFVALEPGADAVDVLRDVQERLGGQPVWVSGPAAERAQNDQVIDVMLAVVVGLLGVAVLISLLGVANTLSLSTIERRRESATLRAIGLSRRRLRATLAAEGVLIASVGAVLGSVLGLLYGWAGAATVFGQLGQTSVAVPWRDLGLVLVVAVGAGLLASVLPGRAAARTSPVAALAVE